MLFNDSRLRRNFQIDKQIEKLESLGSQQIDPDENLGIRRIKYERVIEASTTRLVLDRILYDTLVSTTPDVLNRQYFLSHASATTVTNFLNGQDGQHLYILGNGNTTLTHGTNIFTTTGANKVLAANLMYHLVCHDSKWYEIGA